MREPVVPVSDEPLQQAIQAGHSICLTEAGRQRLN